VAESQEEITAGDQLHSAVIVQQLTMNRTQLSHQRFMAICFVLLGLQQLVNQIVDPQDIGIGTESVPVVPALTQTHM